MSLPETARRDRPWVFRTYSGHSSARASNELYRQNLAKGQTGLSVAFDLPTQTGVDSDHPLARGEVGKVGVPICHLDDMQALFADIPLDRMNTSMTINATAAWLLALYVGAGGAHRRRPARARGHHTERHHQGIPVARHLHLPARSIDAADQRHDRVQRRRDAALEPDQHLLVPPAGGGRDAGAGDRLRDGERAGRARRRARARRPAARMRSRAWSGASPSSSTRASASSRRPARSAR